MDVRGSHDGTGCRFAVVVSMFNEEITGGLLHGARSALAEAGVRDEDIVVVHVPGAFEIPVASLRLAGTGTYDAVICLGCLIKGDTMHFEYIATAASQGIMTVSTTTGVPVAFGVLTALTDEQAEMRSAPGPGNKGREAALAAVEMATLFKQLGGPAAPAEASASAEASADRRSLGAGGSAPEAGRSGRRGGGEGA